MKISKLVLLLLAVVMVGTLSCDDDLDYGKLRQKELELLANYIKDNNITESPKKSGLYYLEIEQGTGDSIKVNDKVHVYYRTWLIDKQLIDENIDSLGRYYEPLAFTVVPLQASTSVIQGLNEGVQLMQEGGKATLLIPSELGYGQNTSSGIPMFSTLIMDVWVRKVFKATVTAKE